MKDELGSVAERRKVLKAVVGAGLALSFFDIAPGQEVDPRNSRPQPEDRLVFAFGERQGQAVGPEDLVPGGPPVLAYPMDPASGTPRDGSRLNQVLVIRLSSEELSESTRAFAASGIVAYSAVCTHTACDVSEWREETKTLVCSCHDSAFDSRDGARVLGGPAPRRLPALPLKLVDGVLLVAGRFSGRVGGDQR